VIHILWLELGSEPAACCAALQLGDDHTREPRRAHQHAEHIFPAHAQAHVAGRHPRRRHQRTRRDGRLNGCRHRGPGEKSFSQRSTQGRQGSAQNPNHLRDDPREGKGLSVIYTHTQVDRRQTRRKSCTAPTHRQIRHTHISPDPVCARPLDRWRWSVRAQGQ
jgi:hypothetical protein